MITFYLLLLFYYCLTETNDDSYIGDEEDFYETHESTITTPVSTPVRSPSKTWIYLVVN